MAPRLTVRLFATAVLMTATVAGPLSGQRPPPERRGGPPGGRVQLEERVRTRMWGMMAERLELTDDESRSLSEVVVAFELRRRDLMERQSDVRREVNALIESSSGDEEAAAGFLATMIELRQIEHSLFVQEQAALLEVLSPMKVIRFQSFREEIGARIRRLRAGENGDRRRRGGGHQSGGDPEAAELQREAEDALEDVAERLEEHRKMSAQVDSMQSEMEALERVMEEAGQADAELRSQLEELQELLSQMTGKELQ